jgi:Tfp pilus assembly protein PilV
MPGLSSTLFRVTLRKIPLPRLADIVIVLFGIGTLCGMSLRQADTRIQSVVADTLVERTASMSHVMRSSAEDLLQQMDFFHIEQTTSEATKNNNATDASAWVRQVINQHTTPSALDKAA